MDDVYEMSVRELIAALGRSAIIDACGVKTQAVTNWIAAGAIPPGHFPAIRRLCEATGIAVPERLFFGAAA